jgi:Tfp pilus assembly protein PilO
MPDIELNKKTVAVIVGVVVVVVIAVFLLKPLFLKVDALGRELKTLEEEMVSSREVISRKELFRRDGHLLKRQEVSRAIGEMTDMGGTFNINFLSTSPQIITRPEGSPYPVLPIRMNVRSEYKDFGLFLGGLENLKGSIVTVKSFDVTTGESILPRVKVELVVEVYLREGEDG